MALIVCKECGRKISDTSKQCIHCGSVLEIKHTDDTIESNNSTFEETVEKEAVNDYDESADNVKDFASLSIIEKMQLEKEFAKSDKWVFKYIRRKTEFGCCRRSFLWAFWTGIALRLILLLIMNAPLSDIEYYIVNPGFAELTIILLVVLFLLCFIMFIYGIIGPIYFAITRKKYVYTKKLMNWLNEEKGVKYAPVFSEKKQRILDSIQLD